jgi:probable HAF family extracellular repeat protein
MKLRTLFSLRTLAALGFLATSSADAASIYRTVDFGANVADLQLNDVGQVAGTRWNADNSSSGFLYNDSTGKSTSLAPGVRPISLTDDGRVIDARGPFSYYQGGGLARDLVDYYNPTAGNHKGQLVGTSFFTPYWPDRTPFPSPYLYTPSPAGSPPNGQYIDALRIVYGAYELPYVTPKPDDPTGRGYYEALGDVAHIRPTGINDSGQIIGNHFPADPVYPPPNSGGHSENYSSHAFLDRQDLGTLGGTNSHADAINNAGQVVGDADTKGGALHAFLFTKGMMQDLGVLPGMTSSEGLGLNDKADVVGTSGGHAFLYSNGIMEDLNDRLPATLGLTLDRAVAINDAGQILAYGHGIDGVDHGLLLSPVAAPEPTTLALLGLAAAGYGVRLRLKSNPPGQPNPAGN